MVRDDRLKMWIGEFYTEDFQEKVRCVNIARDEDAKIENPSSRAV